MMRDGREPPDTGDMLVFLPGAGEIRRTADRLPASGLAAEATRSTRPR